MGQLRSPVRAYLAGMDRVPGWFAPVDAELMVAVSDEQACHGIAGDLLEIGVYKGKSAILLGYLTAAGEQLHACDVFGAPGTVDSAEPATLTGPYRKLTQADFERHYTAFHGELPVVHACPSRELRGRLAPASLRFVHLDGSHAYDDLAADIELALELLVPGGVLVLDDYRSPHTPGVALAVWEAVSAGRIEVACLTENKLYAVAPGDPLRGELQRAVAARPGFRTDEHHLGAQGTAVRIWLAGPGPDPRTGGESTASTRGAHRSSTVRPGHLARQALRRVRRRLRP